MIYEADLKSEIKGEFEKMDNKTYKRRTHTSTEVKRRYNKKVYTRIFADLPTELVEQFKEIAKINGDTTASIFRECIKDYIKKNEGKMYKNGQ